MKKLWAVMLSLFFLLGYAYPVMAIPNQGELYAKVTEKIDNQFKIPIVDGAAEITFSDGTVLSVSDVNVPNDQGFCMVVIPMTEQEALDWVAKQAEADKAHMHSYVVYVVDANNNRVENLEKAKISIQPAQALQNPAMLFLDAFGNAKTLELMPTDDTKNTALSTPNGIFVITERKIIDLEETTTKGETESATNGTEKEDQTTPEIPKTDAKKDTVLWVLLSTISFLTAVFFLSNTKKKTENH